METAAAVMLQGTTAHYLTHSTFPLQPGDTALVHAGAGGVGQLIVQAAKIRGARVIATAGSEAKASGVAKWSTLRSTFSAWSTPSMVRFTFSPNPRARLPLFSTAAAW